MENNTGLTAKVGTFFQQVALDYRIELAFLYGSYAAGYAREDSDLDVAILFSPDLTDREIFAAVNKLSLRLSELLAMEVNILPLYEDFRKPMLYYNAIALGIPVYIRDFKRYVDLKLMALHQMEDFSIFGVKWQLELAQKNLEVLKNG